MSRLAHALRARVRGCARAVLLAVMVIGGCTPAPVVHEIAGESMGTTWSVKYVSAAPVALRTAITAELDIVMAEMSTWEPTSAISRFNRAEAGTWHPLPPGFRIVLEAALDLARETGGAFDPTVGPLVALWGFGPAGPRSAPPSDAEIEALRGRVGWQALSIDADGRLRQPGGVHVDLSSIAKGYAVDRMAAALDATGIADYLVEAGGELRARGRRPDGGVWRVAVQRPDGRDDGVAEIVELRDMAIATSGDYRAYFEREGRRYSHTIDPRTGRPVEHALASVTVLHRECMQADALATALTVLGPENGFEFAQSRGIAALFIEARDGGWVERTTAAYDAWIANR